MSESLDHSSAASALEVESRGLRNRSNIISGLRFVLFVALAGAIAMVLGGTGALWPLPLAAILLIAFLAAMLWHGGVHDALERNDRLLGYHKRGLDRCQGQWDHEQDDGSSFPGATSQEARDLDLTGRRGLFALLNTAGSRSGLSALAYLLFQDQGWHPERGKAVEVLGSQHAWRARLYAATSRDDSDGDLALERWVEEPPPAPSPVLLVVATILSILAVLGIAWVWYVNGAFAGLMVGFGLVAVFMPFDRLAVSKFRDITDPDGERRRLLAWRDGLSVVAELDDSAAIGELADLRTTARDALPALDTLVDICHAMAKRKNPIWSMGPGAIMLHEWKVLNRLHKWAVANGSQLADWGKALGRAEVLSCLATYAAEQGGVTVTVTDEGPMLSATDLCHPLLDPQKRVGNDVALDSGQILLLTGANASGKSTFIRACALALLAARLGLPVPAKSCSVRRQRLATVMRLVDDLEAGKSRFQSEVAALAHAVTIAKEPGDPTMVLLDEVLAGTNSHERHLGTKAVMEHLSGGEGVLLVTTHDLALAELAEEHPGRLVLAHFADDAGDHDLAFDYRLREGIVQSTNALAIMRVAGLPVDG